MVWMTGTIPLLLLRNTDNELSVPPCEVLPSPVWHWLCQCEPSWCFFSTGKAEPVAHEELRRKDSRTASMSWCHPADGPRHRDSLP